VRGECEIVDEFAAGASMALLAVTSSRKEASWATMEYALERRRVFYFDQLFEESPIEQEHPLA
jgi:hypothetical protein